MMTIFLVTGATGKVGRAFIEWFLADRRFAGFRVRALCHNRTLDAHPRLEVVRGSIEHRAVVDAAVAGVTHVLHLAPRT
jgi:UDP-glucose 4-epimerase